MLTHLKHFFTNKQTIAIGTGFFILGFLFGNWATLIPYVKTFYDIDDDTLGLLLLCLPLGAMTFNPVAAMLIQKYTAQKTMVLAMFTISIAYMLPVSVSSLYLLPFGLVLIGICMTFLNISVNSMAALMESNENIQIMSTCHGLFSVGLMAGSLMRSFTLLLDINEQWHMIFMGLLTIVMAFLVKKTITAIPYQSIHKQENSSKSGIKMIVPKGALLTIILISLCVNVTEGTMTDWASLYMKEVVQTSPYFIGWGLFGYSALMATGRFFGDGIIPVFGRNKVLMYGALLAILGLMVVIFFPYTTTAVLGFGLVGLGVSCGAPILYASASRYPGIPGAGGLAIMNTYAMGGFLLGPAVIGFISSLTSLPMAFGVVVGLGFFWLYQASKVELP